MPKLREQIEKAIAEAKVPRGDHYGFYLGTVDSDWVSPIASAVIKVLTKIVLAEAEGLREALDIIRLMPHSMHDLACKSVHSPVAEDAIPGRPSVYPCYRCRLEAALATPAASAGGFATMEQIVKEAERKALIDREKLRAKIAAAPDLPVEAGTSEPPTSYYFRKNAILTALTNRQPLPEYAYYSNAKGGIYFRYTNENDEKIYADIDFYEIIEAVARRVVMKSSQKL